MAVALASISPAAGTVWVPADSSFTLEVTDTVDLDLALIEVLVNGVSCTVANGGLTVWRTKAISGGAIVDDRTDVYVGTLLRWGPCDSATITVELVYNTSSIGTATYLVAPETYSLRGAAYWTAWETTPSWRNASSGAWFAVIDWALSLVRGEAYWVASEPPRGTADLYWWAAHAFASSGGAAFVVGEVFRLDGGAAYTVQGYTLTHGSAAYVVQGWFLLHGAAAFTAGNVYTPLGASAAYVCGQPTVTHGAAAFTVYQVNRRTTIEVAADQAATQTFYAALEITWL